MSHVQIWRPLGRLIEPEATNWWASHAAYPTAQVHGDGLVTIYFSARDGGGRSALASVDFGLDGEYVRRLGPVAGPLFTHGARGTFDADGVTVTSLVPSANGTMAFYLGWTLGVGVPFTNFIGLALGDAKGRRFRRVSPVPVLGRTRATPLTLGYPWVLPVADGYRMWFGSHTRWGAERLAMTHVIREANSRDGLDWRVSARPAVSVLENDPDEFAVSRPVVIAEADGSWSMWYARRYQHYRLGYARSLDGRSWVREDAAVRFDGIAAPWESEERTYPCVFDHRGRRYMLYNGNGYGRTGFGIAILDS